MANSRLLLTLLLLGSIHIPLIIPEARNQTMASATNVQYITTATTVYSTIQMNTTYTQPVPYMVTPYGYDDQTGSFSLTQMKDTTGVGRGGGSKPCLYYDYFLLNATKGHEIRGHLEAYQRPPYAVKEAPVNFIILTLDQLQRFEHSYCGRYDHWGWMVYTYASSYDFSWVVPLSGEYAFLFLSSDLPYYGTISFTARDYVRTVQNSTVTCTSDRTYTLQSTQIMESTQPNMNPQPSSHYLAALITLMIIGLLISLITLKMKHSAR